jgi:hypothetical protein
VIAVALINAISGGSDDPDRAVPVSQPVEDSSQSSGDEALRAEEAQEQAPAPEPEPEPVASCHPSYDPCLDPNASDYDCEGGSGDGPEYTGFVTVTGPDDYGLDSDGDGTGCES